MAVASLRTHSTKRPEYLQAEHDERFSLEPIVEDLARTSDRATATFALRRLEYRSKSVRLEGRSLSVITLLVPVLLGAAGGMLVVAVLRLRGD